jgi:glutamate-ammonia-ligase adenylyltransferase
MKRPAKPKVSRKAADAKSRLGPRSKGATLAEQIASAPSPLEPKTARARVNNWLAALKSAEAKLLRAIFAKNPAVSTLLDAIAESSPYLSELIAREPQRLVRLLQADPDEHFKALLREHASAAAASDNDAEAMRLLRRMKAEAALLIALVDIGGVWPIMRTAQALTELANTAVDSAVRYVLSEAVRAGRLKVKD